MTDFDTFIRVAKAVSDPGRVKILKMLEQREMCACEIVAALNLAQPTVSKHLKQLTDAGLITSRKDGAWMHFRLAAEQQQAITKSIPPSSDIRLAMLAFLKSYLNDDAAVLALREQLPILSPEKLQCKKL